MRFGRTLPRTVNRLKSGPTSVEAFSVLISPTAFPRPERRSHSLRRGSLHPFTGHQLIQQEGGYWLQDGSPLNGRRLGESTAEDIDLARRIHQYKIGPHGSQTQPQAL